LQSSYEAAEHASARGGSALPRISIVIPVLNDAARLARCLASIAANTYPRELREIIVADNGSTDDSRDVATRFGATVLSLPGIKVAKVRNEAARVASGDIVAFVDADHEIVPQWLERAAASLSDATVVGAGAAYSPPPGGRWVQRQYNALRGPTRGRANTEWLGSGNLAVRRSAFDAVGGFDDTLETCEDVDLCQRLRARGGTLIADEGLKSVHLGDPDSLAAIFRGELWRGRDNLRVSLRGPLSLRAVPSVAIPVLDIVFLLMCGVALLLRGRALWLAAVGAGGFIALSLLRTARILANLDRHRPVDLPGAFAVAATYDLGRALALLVPASHGVRRRPAAA
jgi:hypothetical protein